MARQQKKKSSGSKKKKKQGTDSKQISPTKSNVPEKRPSLFSGGTSDAVRQYSGTPINPVSRVGFIHKGMQFLREVKVELKKVTWPSRKQTVGSTVVVLILVIIIAFFLGVVDIGLSSLVRLILQ